MDYVLWDNVGLLTYSYYGYSPSLGDKNLLRFPPLYHTIRPKFESKDLSP